MRKFIFLFISLASLLFFLSANSCKKHKDVDPLSQLPPETQTGANTFGCVVNGKAFLPKGPSISPILFCYYQFLNNSSDHGYFFGLAGSDKSNSDDVWGIGLYTDSLQIHTGSFNLINNGKGNFFGKYTRVNQGGSFFIILPRLIREQ